MANIPTFGNFRSPKEGENINQYFVAAVFKAAKLAGVKQEHEGSIKRFVSAILGRAKGKHDELLRAYFYAQGRFKAKGDFHLCADDLKVEA